MRAQRLFSASSTYLLRGCVVCALLASYAQLLCLHTVTARYPWYMLAAQALSCVNALSAYAAAAAAKPRYCAREEVHTAGAVLCTECEGIVYKTPNAHHCSRCRRCVVGMDHHCPWLGHCIGVDNLGPFLILLCWGEVYALTAFASTFPIWLYQCVHISASQRGVHYYALTGLCFVAFGAFVALGCLLLVELALIARDTTMVEAAYGKRSPSQKERTLFESLRASDACSLLGCLVPITSLLNQRRRTRKERKLANAASAVKRLTMSPHAHAALV